MSRAKDLGTKGETAVSRFLQDHGFVYADRIPNRGANDIGDITIGDPSVVQEVKFQHAMSLAQWVDETETERDKAGADIGLLWHKRWGKGSPGDWYVTSTGWTAVKLLRSWCGINNWPLNTVMQEEG